MPVYFSSVIPRLHDRANIKQTSSKHRAGSSSYYSSSLSQLVEPAWSCKRDIRPTSLRTR